MKIIRRCLLLVLAAVISILIVACGSAPKKAQPDEASANADAGTELSAYAEQMRAAYQIQPGDKLAISVYGEEDLQKEVVVRPDGGITFPLVGDLQAGGRSVAQLQQDIAAGLTRYISEPEVSVTVQEVVGNKVFVLGQVKNPGEYVLTGGTSVLQALSMAGGITAFANRSKIKVIRRDKVTGQETVIPFDYGKVMRGKGLDKNIVLMSGDTVIVP